MEKTGKSIGKYIENLIHCYKTFRNCGVIQNSELGFLLIMNNS
jgi:hypothetical protein